MRPVPGISFDRVADIYDATRGGERRGANFAAALAPWIAGPTVVELGIGTGLIAHGLQRHGIDVVGVDLSEPMMRRAIGRVGERVAAADVDELPLADDSVDTAYLVWVLQLVPDPPATLAEAARVVRPGGRIVTILSAGEYDDDEIAPIVDGLTALRPQRWSRADVIAASVPGLSLRHDGDTGWDEVPSTVTEQIHGIENRIYSSMFDVDDASWDRVVAPVLEQLRTLPEPDRPRLRRIRHPLVVWDVVPGI